ncbi:MAG: type II toxin-antitoxin system VapC family toxin [Flavobacteriales bacterium]|nr:type II toxin-antitoxin system VapC family toxin [Flavobacteriales bacterium]MBK6883326.1 type II toxin-antitoxin system VapC family toxin [Flavobacteriales bacterium]MBK7102968.1 type II toxin-antitoxin system VapC family toxin [Flavobacteriales bacterium]MBK7113930.1 type II toxin-antitoxin system VapC family toxin [Flavobacteriales bacterium]MBK7620679.1 type II toxin-antitoxin system VapC family toxin [Flavobacteriales bacterium]
MRVVVDTSLLIDLAAGDSSAAVALNGLEISVSIITCIEFLSWPKLTEAGLPIAEALLDQYNTEGIGRAIRDQAAFIKRSFGLKLPDAVIAATALHLKAPLITRDKGFQKVVELIEVRMV